MADPAEIRRCRKALRAIGRRCKASKARLDENRAERDIRIAYAVQLGLSEREIGSDVGISGPAVHALKRGFKKVEAQR